MRLKIKTAGKARYCGNMLRALDFTDRRYRYKHYIDEVEREKNRTKSSAIDLQGFWNPS